MDNTKIEKDSHERRPTNLTHKNNTTLLTMKAMKAAALVTLALAEPCSGWAGLSPQHGMHPARCDGGGAACGATAAAAPAVVGRRDALLRAGAGAALLPLLLPQHAAADMTLNSFKRSYFRWVPRIEAGKACLPPATRAIPRNLISLAV